jgi:hypothetical protein
LFAIGEIDCREDDGILPYLFKNPNKSMSDVINKTIISYLEYIKNIGAINNRKVIIQGIPSPRVERLAILTPEKAEKLCHLIILFNQTLKKYSIDNNFSFLNLYLTTSDLELGSSGRWHIDNYHLNSQAILDSWQRGFYPAPDFINHCRLQ